MKNSDKNRYRDKNIPTKFQYRVLRAIERLGISTKYDVYNNFSGGRTMSSIASVLVVLKNRGWVQFSRNTENHIVYSVTDKWRSLKNKGVKHLKSRTLFTKYGLCDKCHKSVEDLTRKKVSETSEGENVFEYLCRSCLCPDEDLCIEKIAEDKTFHHLRTAENFETISEGDLKLLQKSVKKHNKDFKVSFGRM